MSTPTGTPILTTLDLWEHLFGEQEGFLVTFTGRQSDRPEARPNQLEEHQQRSWAYPQLAEKAAEYLQQQSDAGRDVYFGVHLFKEPGTRRKDNAVEEVSALWCDTDGAVLPADYPEPNIRVESSPGREHLYLLLSRPIPVAEATKLNQRIAYGMSADRGKWGLGTVLRVPGTRNFKREEPTLVTARLVSSEPYDPEDLDSVIPAAEEVVLSEKARNRREQSMGQASSGQHVSAAGEPPVKLSPADLEAWQGTRTVAADDGGVDRSRTLHWIACVVARGLRRAGISEVESHRIVADAVEERDFALGYQKYTGRDDRAERYAELAGEGIAEAARDISLSNGNANGSSSGIGAGDGGPTAGTTTTAAPGVYRLTDMGNAERLAARHGQDIRYIYAWAKYLVWDGSRFKMDDTGEVDRCSKETVRSIYTEAANTPDADKRNALVSHAKRSEARSRVEAMASLLRSEPGIAVRVEDLDSHPWLVNARNGTIDLKNGILRPHDRADLITQIMPVDYDPDAKSQVFEKFLETILPSEVMRRYVKRLFGQALYGRVAEHILPILHGTGANGKSTLLTLLLETIGDYGLMAADDLLLTKSNAHPTEQADLYGKRLVINVETDQDRRLAESRVKKLTGGERIRARRMREDFWEFSATHSILSFKRKEFCDGLYVRRKTPSARLPRRFKRPSLAPGSASPGRRGALWVVPAIYRTVSGRRPACPPPPGVLRNYAVPCTASAAGLAAGVPTADGGRPRTSAPASAGRRRRAPARSNGRPARDA